MNAIACVGVRVIGRECIVGAALEINTEALAANSIGVIGRECIVGSGVKVNTEV